MLIVDCANGVGSVAVQQLARAIPTSTLQLHRCNTAQHSHGQGCAHRVNDGCGSDFVQSGHGWPAGALESMQSSTASLCCSLDGDADRIVFYFSGHEAAHGAQVAESSCRVLDGDYIASLVATFVLNQLSIAGDFENMTVGAQRC